MSANNQTLIQKYRGKYYVLPDIQAESWISYDEKKGTFNEKRINELSLGPARGYKIFHEAYKAAERVERNYPTEYGIQVNRLCKDGAKVRIKK